MHGSNRKWLITHLSNRVYRVYPTYIWVIRWLSPPLQSHLWQKLATLGKLLTQAALIPKRCLSRIARTWTWEVTVYAFNGAKQRHFYESKSWQLCEQPKCWQMIFDPTDMIFQCTIGFDRSRYDQQCLVEKKTRGASLVHTTHHHNDLISD